MNPFQNQLEQNALRQQAASAADQVAQRIKSGHYKTADDASAGSANARSHALCGTPSAGRAP